MLKSICKKFPFSVGTTSYILSDKEDNLIKNIEFLKDNFDIIQLLYFSIDYLDIILNNEIIKKIESIAKESSLKFIAHLPLDLDLLNEEKKVITKAIDVINYIFEKTITLDIEKFVIHIDRYKNGKQLSIKLNNKTKDSFYNTLIELGKNVCINKEKICIENTNYDLTFMKELIINTGFRVCFDIGHLILRKQKFDDFIKSFEKIIDVVHVHGVRGKTDHLALTEIPVNERGKIFHFLSKFKKYLIIEVFSLENLVKSIDFMINNDCLLKN